MGSVRRSRGGHFSETNVKSQPTKASTKMLLFIIEVLIVIKRFVEYLTKTSIKPANEVSLDRSCSVGGKSGSNKYPDYYCTLLNNERDIGIVSV